MGKTANQIACSSEQLAMVCGLGSKEPICFLDCPSIHYWHPKLFKHISKPKSDRLMLVRLQPASEKRMGCGIFSVTTRGGELSGAFLIAFMAFQPPPSLPVGTAMPF
jgi:hypothetical protein